MESAYRVILPEIDFFVFDAALKASAEDVVESAAAAIHGSCLLP